MKRLTLAVLLLVAASASQARPADAVVTLRLPEGPVLPGVPFDLELTLKNVSRRPVKVGDVAYLSVSREDGTPIALYPQWAVIQLEGRDNVREGFFELAPGESLRRVIGWDNARVADWFAHEAFSGPGVYEFEFELKLGHYLEDENLSNYVGPIRTPPARLERAVPKGEDESLWNRMQEVSEGHWSDNGFTRLEVGKALAREIIAVHPSSSYYPYALLLIWERREKDIPVLLEAAERFRDSAVYPYLLEAAGDAARIEASRADDRKEATRSAHFYELSEKYYNAALQTSSLAIRWGAEFGLRQARAARERAARTAK
jgi:hypothetical protein